MTTNPWATVQRINQLLADTSTESANTSMRIPSALREAASLAVRDLGAATSTTALTVDALRLMLKGIVIGTVLELHYAANPEARPDLAERALAAAEIDGHPLAQNPGAIRKAATEILTRHSDATPEDVLLWAEARTLTAA